MIHINFTALVSYVKVNKDWRTEDRQKVWKPVRMQCSYSLAKVAKATVKNLNGLPLNDCCLPGVNACDFFLPYSLDRRMFSRDILKSYLMYWQAYMYHSFVLRSIHYFHFSSKTTNGYKPRWFSTAIFSLKKRYCRYPRNCNVSFSGRCFYLFVWKLSKLLQISYNSSNKKGPNKVITFITHQPFDFSVHKYSMFSKAIKWSTNILMSVVEL